MKPTHFVIEINNILHKFELVVRGYALSGHTFICHGKRLQRNSYFNLNAPTFNSNNTGNASCV